MRARMAIKASGYDCELREVVLRDKPDAMLEASPKATVPVLVERDGTVREESLDIMHRVLADNDPDGWLQPPKGTRAEMDDLIAIIDGPFKHHLDRYKYAARYAQENDGAGVDPLQHRAAAVDILQSFEERLANHAYLCGDRLCLADIAAAPFVRQFANTDAAWFAAQPLPHLQRWLDGILQSDLFMGVMKKYAQWQSDQPGVPFPE